jgi:hypothetical protein
VLHLIHWSYLVLFGTLIKPKVELPNVTSVKFMFEQGGKFNLFFAWAKFRHLATQKKRVANPSIFFVQEKNKSQYLEKEKEKLNLPDLDHSF